jgi:hypothetical protein
MANRLALCRAVPCVDALGSRKRPQITKRMPARITCVTTHSPQQFLQPFTVSDGKFRIFPQIWCRLKREAKGPFPQGAMDRTELMPNVARRTVRVYEAALK